MAEARGQNAVLRRKRYEDGFRVMQGRREYVTYSDNSSVRVWHSDVPWRYDMHMHSAVEIILTLEGSVESTVNDTDYVVRKDEILIIPPEFSHSLDMGEQSSRLLFLFEPDILSNLRDVMSRPGLFQRVFYLHDGSDSHIQIRTLLLKIANVHRSGDTMWNTLAYSYLLRIYAMLAEQYLAPVLPRNKDNIRVVDREIIASSMSYINEHYQEELSLDDVARFAGFSRYYFSRSFKKHTGYFFKDYLCQKRLQVAMELLIRTEEPMKEVAIHSGFGSVATFNRVFREKNGCTPTHYRALYGIA